jgi:hypothetical protein
MEKICQLRWGNPISAPGYSGVWGAAPSDAAAAAGAAPPPAAGPMSSEEVMRRMIRATGGLPSAPPGASKTAADEAEFLLQVAAEVEHGLLVQYLSAGYSSSDTASEGQRGRLVDIAIQEMDHLLNVQNMLLALKRRPYFGRGNFPPSPERVKFYPFPFRLEPISEQSLGKYVTAESPTEALGAIDLSLLTPEQKGWLPRAVGSGKAGAGQTINHVGVLYATIYWMFQEDDKPVEPWWLPADVFAGKVRHVQEEDFADAVVLDAREGDALEFKSQPGPATDQPFRVVWNVKNRAAVRLAIAQIAEQGEGTKFTADSHFVKFLQLFGEFVTKADAGQPTLVLPLPTNPNTANDPATADGRITHPVALLWAKLFNARYRILLAKLALALSESTGENTGGSGLASRDQLVPRLINREMKGPFGLRGIANRLITLPLRADGTGMAAPPFEMPSAPLPTEPAAHRDFLVTLFADAAVIIDALMALPGAPAGLAQLKASDAQESADVSLMSFTP